jgi:Flp pilus assembly protein TadG
MRRRRGQALVELTLALPLILTLLVGMFNVGHLLMVYVALHTATRDGAQMACYDHFYTDEQIKQRIIAMANGIDLKAEEITVSQTQTLTVQGQDHRAFDIKIAHAHRFIAPFLLFSQKTWTLTSSVRCLVTGARP